MSGRPNAGFVEWVVLIIARRSRGAAFDFGGVESESETLRVGREAEREGRRLDLE